MFIVLEFNQASHQPEGQHVEVHADVAEARETAAILLAENRERGRREHYEVYELVEIEED
jgi:hypothetical protein